MKKKVLMALLVSVIMFDAFGGEELAVYDIVGGDYDIVKVRFIKFDELFEEVVYGVSFIYRETEYLWMGGDKKEDAYHLYTFAKGMTYDEVAEMIKDANSGKNGMRIDYYNYKGRDELFGLIVFE